MSIIAGGVFYENQMVAFAEVYKSDVKKIMLGALNRVKKGRGGNFVFKGLDYQLYYYNDKIVTFMILCKKDIAQDAIISFIGDINEAFNKIVSVDDIEELKNQETIPNENQDEENGEEIQVKQREEIPFQKKFGSHLLGMLREFKPEEYLVDAEENKVALLKDHVNEFGKVVIDAQEEVFKREEKIQNLTTKAEDLKNDSIQYRVGAQRTVKKAKCNKSMIITASVIITLIVVYVILVFRCGGFALEECLNQN